MTKTEKIELKYKEKIIALEDEIMIYKTAYENANKSLSKAFNLIGRLLGRLGI